MINEDQKIGLLLQNWERLSGIIGQYLDFLLPKIELWPIGVELPSDNPYALNTVPGRSGVEKEVMETMDRPKLLKEAILDFVRLIKEINNLSVDMLEEFLRRLTIRSNNGIDDREKRFDYNYLGLFKRGGESPSVKALYVCPEVIG